jgi:hypothetical protein
VLNDQQINIPQRKSLSSCTRFSETTGAVAGFGSCAIAADIVIMQAKIILVKIFFI